MGAQLSFIVLPRETDPNSLKKIFGSHIVRFSHKMWAAREVLEMGIRGVLSMDEKGRVRWRVPGTKQEFFVFRPPAPIIHILTAKRNIRSTNNFACLECYRVSGKRMVLVNELRCSVCGNTWQWRDST